MRNSQVSNVEMNLKNTTIIIPTFNSHAKTSHLIEKLNQQNGDFDIVVVDSGDSEDHLKVKASRILRFKEDLGGAGSFHEGLKYAYENGYEKFILCDNDLVPIDVDLVEEIIKGLDEHDVVTPDKTNPELNYHFLGLRRGVVEKVGYPVKEFFMWGDDLEYSWRINKAGFKVSRINSSFLHPLQPTSPDTPRRIYYNVRNCICIFVLYKKYPKLVRFLLASVAFSAVKFKLKYALMGIADFLKGKSGKSGFAFYVGGT